MIHFDENGQFSYDTLGCLVAGNQNYELVWNNYKQTYFQYLQEYDEDSTLHNPVNTTWLTFEVMKLNRIMKKPLNGIKLPPNKAMQMHKIAFITAMQKAKELNKIAKKR